MDTYPVDTNLVDTNLVDTNLVDTNLVDTNLVDTQSQTGSKPVIFLTIFKWFEFGYPVD
jgi:hypothetical protein